MEPAPDQLRDQGQIVAVSEPIRRGLDFVLRGMEDRHPRLCPLAYPLPRYIPHALEFVRSRRSPEPESLRLTAHLPPPARNPRCKSVPSAERSSVRFGSLLFDSTPG